MKRIRFMRRGGKVKMFFKRKKKSTIRVTGDIYDENNPKEVSKTKVRDRVWDDIKEEAERLNTHMFI